MSMTELALPPIDTAALDKAAHTAAEIGEPRQQPLVAAAPAVPDLTKIDLTDVALAMYGTWRKDVDATKANLSTLVLDLSTPTKIKEARSLRARLITDPLAAARKVSQGIKSKMAATSKAVGAELERIEAAYDEADKLILPKIEAREAELAREREEARQREQARTEKHRTNIEAIRIYVERASAPGMTAERVARGIAQLEALPTPTKEAWEEFAVPAADAICWTLERMRIIHANLLRAEQAEAEAAELRAKLAATEHTPQGANRDASAEQSHVAEGSASPTGRGADGPAAGGAAPVLSLSKQPDQTQRDDSVIAGQAADAAPAGGDTEEAPPIKLGDIAERLGFSLTREFIGARLGVHAIGVHKGAVLFRSGDWPRIKAALIQHLEGLA